MLVDSDIRSEYGCDYVSRICRLYIVSEGRESEAMTEGGIPERIRIRQGYARQKPAARRTHAEKPMPLPSSSIVDLALLSEDRLGVGRASAR